MDNLAEISHQVFERLLENNCKQCSACEEQQPNQVAHYGGCIFPALDFNLIIPTIQELGFCFDVELWYKIAKLVDKHNEETYESQSFYAR